MARSASPARRSRSGPEHGPDRDQDRLRQGQDRDPKPRWYGAAVSLFVHVALIALLATQLQQAQRGGVPAPRPKALQIVMAPPAPPAPPTPPKPVEPPKQELKLTNEPAPVAARPQPPKPQPPAPTPKPPGAATQVPAPATPAPPVETPEESLLGRIHDNWLQPAVVPRNFVCRIQIDYLAGGRISAVKFLRACGDYDLDESVRKAIWKSQPLPLLDALNKPGTIEIEFTP